jgi:hypothetical protein
MKSALFPAKKFDQFLIQIVDRLKDATPETAQSFASFSSLKVHNIIATISRKKIGSRFTITLSPTSKLKKIFRSYRDRSQRKTVSGKSTKLPKVTKSSKNRLSQVTFSALGQKSRHRSQIRLGSRLQKARKLSASVAKSSHQNSTTRLAALLLSTPSLLA